MYHKKFKAPIFILLLAVSFFSLGTPVLAASQNWDGNYDAIVQASCDPWIIMDSWTVANNSVATPYTNADIDQWDGAELAVFAGSTRVELVDFVFKSDSSGKGFTASWIANERSDGSGQQCQGTLNGRCTSGCDSFDLGVILAPGGPILFIVCLVIIIFIIAVVVIVQRARLVPIALPPVAEPIIENPPVAAPPATPPGAPTPAPVTPTPPAAKRPRLFRAVYGKKIWKSSKSSVNNPRIQK